MSHSLISTDPTPTPVRRTGTPTLAVVVPCHNEEAALKPLLECLTQMSNDLVTSGRISRPADLILVDDGSSDATWDLISEASTKHPVIGVRLSRNHGHQRALLAGLMRADADMVVSMDADLQDDPLAVKDMIDAYRSGAEIVYGVRGSRATDSWFKRNSASVYYRLLTSLGVDLIPNHADFRLMSRKALVALEEFGETNLFLRGLVRQVGLRSDTVMYDRAKRSAGESKYPLHKMLALAFEGVTSFSVKPLRMIMWMGFAIAGLSFALTLYSLFAWMFGGTLPGWTSIVIPIYMLGGAHLIALGVIGEYVGKIYQETKRRPRFQVDEVVWPEAEQTPAKPRISAVANG